MRNLLLIAIFLIFVTTVFAQNLSDFIRVDQFGYRTSDSKIAVIRNPTVGNDANLSFTPGSQYALINATNNQRIYTGNIQSINNGAVDVLSGDITWWFDFSTISQQGDYYVLDIQNNVKSHTFKIADNVYQNVLKQAFRTFFYQRSGIEKVAPYAETGWEDGASHLGPQQDTECRYYLTPNDPSTQKDVSGGWYDAGDYNKYTTWTSSYISQMLIAYEENPSIWTDDFNIPESNNGIPDIIDEARWGLDHLLKLQMDNGSFISLVGVGHTSPPSQATGRSLYGGVSTSATLRATATLAYASNIYKKLGNDCYAQILLEASLKGWDWANANPSVIWSNAGTGVGAGDPEVNDYNRQIFKLEAALRLYQVTNDIVYKNHFENNYRVSHLLEWRYVYPYEHYHQEVLLEYTSLVDANPSIVTRIKDSYLAGINGVNNFGAYSSRKSGYNAYLDNHTWGSNNVHAMQGLQYYKMIKFNINPSNNQAALNAGLGHINYIHGVNPLGICYLSNMGNHGAENSVKQFYHSWFYDKNALWDEVGVSTYGPPPGFLVGGPNESYAMDRCCSTNSCGSTFNNNLCNNDLARAAIGQPAMKSYAPINDNWPVNSWELTENSCGYQISYIVLLSKYISNSLTSEMPRLFNNCAVELPCSEKSYAANTNDLVAAEVCEQGEWSHLFANNDPNTILFSIDKNGNDMECSVELNVNGTPIVKLDAVNQIGNVVMKRWWDVTCVGPDYHPTTGKTTYPVNVRFYYDPVDATEIITTAQTVANSWGVQFTDIQWIKTNDGISFDTSYITPRVINNSYVVNPSSIFTGSQTSLSYVQYDGLTGFSGGTAAIGIGSTTILPLDFTTINISKNNNLDVIEWSVSSIQNIEKFRIERSTNGLDFIEVGEVLPIAALDYQFQYAEDLNNLTTYYRIIGIDQEAQTVSQVVTIDNERDDLITFSSPSQKDFTFTLHGLENEVAIVSFYDISGKRISSESYVFNTIHEKIFNTGIYIMHVNHGDFSKSYKVVIY